MGKQSRRKRDRQTEPKRPREQPQDEFTPRQRVQMEVIKGMVEDIKKHGKGCSLCSMPTFNAGIWFPNEEASLKLGAPPGKMRTIVYALCDRCAVLPDVSDRIEKSCLAGPITMFPGPPRKKPTHIAYFTPDGECSVERCEPEEPTP
jgi:hypothetical protein